MHLTKLNLTKLIQKGRNQTDPGGKLQVSTSHSFAVNACAPGRYVLHLGTGHAKVAAELKRKLCHVTATSFGAKEVTEKSTACAPRSAPEPRLPENLACFDQILLMDLIEQLHAPENFMEELRRKMARRGSEVIVTASNVVPFASRLMLALGRLAHNRENACSFGHRRLFTFKSLRGLLEQAGFEIVEARGVPVPFPSAIGDSRWSRMLLKLNQALLKISKHLFAYQICMRARPLPSAAGRLERQPVSSGSALYSQTLGRVA